MRFGHPIEGMARQVKLICTGGKVGTDAVLAPTDAQCRIGDQASPPHDPALTHAGKAREELNHTA